MAFKAHHASKAGVDGNGWDGIEDQLTLGSRLVSGQVHLPDLANLAVKGQTTFEARRVAGNLTHAQAYDLIRASFPPGVPESFVCVASWQLASKLIYARHKPKKTGSIGHKPTWLS